MSGWAAQHGIACMHCASGVTQQPGSWTTVGSQAVVCCLSHAMLSESNEGNVLLSAHQIQVGSSSGPQVCSM